MAVAIRTATLADAPALLEIYRPYVEETAISFEYTAPTLEEFSGRMARILTKYPYLVAEEAGEPLGYAYAGAFNGRRAYDWAAETTVYVRRDRRKVGVGGALYGALERTLKAQNILNLNACVATPETEDEYLTRNSLAFHRHMGFVPVGEFHQCGYKFGRWYNMTWLEKQIGAHTGSPLPSIPFDGRVK